MKNVLFYLFFSYLIASTLAVRASKPSKPIKEEPEKVEEAKPKRQLENGRAIGDAQHIQFGSPGHFVLRTSEKESAASNDQDVEYYNILRQFGEDDSVQAAPVQGRPVQYLVSRQQQPAYAQSQEVSQVQPQAKVIQYQSVPAKRPYYGYQQQRIAQNTFQTPKVVRPQAVKPASAGIYTAQGFVQNAAGQGLHEARVQAALSVSDDKPSYSGPQTFFSGSQQAYHFPGASSQLSELSDGSFEKELAQLISANQATELKAKPQAQQFQYIQQSQIKPAYIEKPQPQQKYAFIRPESQIPKYIMPALTGRAKTPVKQLPQQYLIETSKPQQVQQVQPQPSRQVIYRPRPQYVVSTEEPKYFEYQQDDDKSNAMKIVPAPQLQRTPQSFGAAPGPQKEAEPVIPTYLQYYQAITPEKEDYSSANDVKLESYVPRFSASKPQVSTERPDEQPTYFTYQTQIKNEEPNRFSKFRAVKPQITSQLTTDDDSLIQTLLMHSLHKQRGGGLSDYSSNKQVASTQQKPQVATLTTPSHSSVFVSKAIPKKPSTVAPPVQAAASEEEVPVVRLPPPKNKKVYTQEEFQALLAAGYSVTPVPVVDDDDLKGAFSPAPENYPGHSKYQSYIAESSDPQTYQKQPTETYATVSAATEAPRVRKYRRPINRQSYRPAVQSEDSNIGSDSQPKVSYVSLQPAETVNYGMRTKAKTRAVPQVEETE